jgi:hypothetical protein
MDCVLDFIENTLNMLNLTQILYKNVALYLQETGLH